MAQLHSTRSYEILPWLYFTLVDSTLLYHGSTSLYEILHSYPMALLHSTRLFTLYHGSTSLYLTLYISLPWLYFNLLDST